MSSILTNNSAMVALDTLRNINNDLGGVQNEIATGKKISSSTDNAAIWSIATVMESDVASFDQVSDSLNLGSATVGVAQAGAEQVTELLTEAKALIVGASDPSVSDADRQKYQTDLTELTSTIGSIVDAASFNGQNLLKGEGDIEILSSLNRQDDGTVTAGKVTVDRQNLSTAAADFSDAVDVTGGEAGAVGAATTTIAAESGGTDGTGTIVLTQGTLAEDTTYSATFGDDTVSYTATAGSTAEQAGDGFTAALSSYLAGEVEGTSPPAGVTVAAATSGDTTITFTNTVAASVDVTDVSAETGVVPAGGLNALADIDVTTLEGASEGLEAIDALLQTAIDATAQFGSKQSRLDNQNEFITSLSDALTTGIGAMTDADMEEASAKLQSLQVQQQLGVQALSIANSAPQQLLSLFR